jgi:hypothetical protein
MKYLVLALLLGSAATASAQRVHVRGYGEADLDAVLRSTINHPHQLIVRDMTISRGDTVRGDFLVVRARLVVEGTIIGNVVGVDANMYFRPGAVVTGTVTNVAGGFYPSELARFGGTEDRPLAPYNVRTENGDFVIEGTNRRPAIKLGGMFGVQNPEYNRVDGLRAEFGPTLLLPPFGGVEPFISGSVGYATEREDVILRAGIGAKRGRSTLQFGWEDNVTETNDRWIRSDLKNSLSFIWNGKDYRNYYEAQRWFGEFNRTLEKGRRTTRYWIRGQREDASPLIEGDPFIVLKPDSIRENPLIPASTITSLIFGGESEWTGLSSTWRANGWIESAGSDLVDSDHSFNMYGVDALYAMKAIANHTLEIEGSFRGPLPGTEDLPQQRWTHVGGSGTLYTFDIGQFRGDRLAFLETEYTIPFSEKLQLPFLGLPRLKLMHNIGMAWSRATEDRDFEQNIGARIQFSVAHVRFVMDPRSGEQKWSVGVSFPSKTYPWEKATQSPLPR